MQFHDKGLRAERHAGNGDENQKEAVRGKAQEVKKDTADGKRSFWVFISQGKDARDDSRQRDQNG